MDTLIGGHKSRDIFVAAIYFLPVSDCLLLLFPFVNRTMDQLALRVQLKIRQQREEVCLEGDNASSSFAHTMKQHLLGSFDEGTKSMLVPNQ